MPILIQDREKDRAEFINLHRGPYIGSSEIAAISGLNPWWTALDVWMIKTGRREPDPDNLRLWFGRRVEPVIAELFEKVMGGTVELCSQVIQHPIYEYAISSPDARWYPGKREDGYHLVEIKSTGLWAKKYWHEEVPDPAHCQLQWQLMCDNRAVDGYFAALIGGDATDLKRPRIVRNDELVEQMRALAEKFLKLVETDEPPAATSGDAENILELWNPDGLDVLDFGKDKTIQQAIKEYHSLALADADANRQIRTRKPRKEELKNRIIQALGNHSQGVLGDYMINAKRIDRKAYSVDAKSYIDLRVKTPGD